MKEKQKACLDFEKAVELATEESTDLVKKYCH